MPPKTIEKEWGRVGGLSQPRKMPCYSYSLPAEACNVGSKLQGNPGTACGHCYALKGFYVIPNVQSAMERRLQAIRAPTWVGDMTKILRYYLERPRGKQYEYFRWHDSGDVQDQEHLDKIFEVCYGTPEIRHWIPTREYRLFYDNRDRVPENLTVRVSAAVMGVEPPDLGFPTSTVHTDEGNLYGRECPAESGKLARLGLAPKGECGPCRVCWNPNTENVSYGLH